MKQIKTLGIVLEREADAKALGLNMEHLYHWRADREISAIIQGINSYGYETKLIGTPEDFFQQHKDIEVDGIFNLSVGFLSQFRLAKGPMLYEIANLPYTGANPFTKTVTQNKHINKAFFDKIGIITPPWSYISLNGTVNGLELPDYPLIVKPAYEGSSIGINTKSLVHDFDGLMRQVAYIRETLHMPVIIEQFIIGREFKVGVIGNGLDKSIYMIEDVHEDGTSIGEEFLYFQVKTYGIYHKIARDIDKAEYRELKEACLKAYELFEPVDYGTFDIRMDDQGQYYIIEFNCDATLHPDRTLAKCCQLHGIDYKTMIHKILDAAKVRWEVDDDL